MEDYQQRVLTEKVELDEKRRKLLAFLQSGMPNATPDRELLKMQYEAMTDYSGILGQRIEGFDNAN